jgi:hypothetical protein
MEYHALPSSHSSSDSGASPATVTPCGLFEADCFVCECLNCNYINTFLKLVSVKYYKSENTCFSKFYMV